MSLRYRTVTKNAAVEQVIERSRFIGRIAPVQSREEAETFIAGIRMDEKDASHHVPAMVIGEQSNLQWGSDDGEPQGTAGAPLVQLLVKEGLTNVVLVVTRYFGGIKLGPGGLVRAYTSTGKLAIEAAGTSLVSELALWKLGVAYPYYGKIENLASAEGAPFSIESANFGECVILELAALSDELPLVRKRIADITGGNYEELELANILRPFPESG